MPLSDEEPVALSRDFESDRAERKESFAGETPDRARQAVCAFANDLPDHRAPGVLFVGLRDDGSPSGLPIDDQLLRQLADMKYDGQILPPPTLIVEKRTVSGTAVAVVEVLPSDSPPVRYRGRIWIRVGPRRGFATAQDERLLSEKRRYRDLSFDLQPLPMANIAQILRRLDDKLEAHIQTAVDISTSPETRSPDYPLGALQQIVRNALMHRIYEATNAPVRVSWFNDRIEILSPGGPYGIVNRENFGEPGYTDYRNPNIAEAMRVLGFVQRFGVGIQTARRQLQLNGNPPLELDPRDSVVLATIRRKQ